MYAINFVCCVYCTGTGMEVLTFAVTFSKIEKEKKVQFRIHTRDLMFNSRALTNASQWKHYRNWLNVDIYTSNPGPLALV